jgi:hypothetical protein
MLIAVNICLSDLDKSRIFTSSKTGKRYLELLLFDNRLPDPYGNDGVCRHRLAKEERESGEKATIVGNWRWLKKPNPPSATPPKNPTGNSIGQPTAVQYDDPF